jgi:hypothetical protein
MPSLPLEQWQTALDRMDSALAGALRALDRAEERWEMAVAPSAGEGEPPTALDRLDSRLREWESRLREAEELTRAAEKELAERAVAAERWRAAFARWAELLQQGVSTSPLP